MSLNVELAPLKDSDNKQHVVKGFKNVLDGVFSTEDMMDEKLEDAALNLDT